MQNSAMVRPTRRGWKTGLWVLVLAPFLMGSMDYCKGDPPVITTLDPAAGPTGTMVMVSGEHFALGGTVLFDGVATGTQGTGSPLVFTVPYDATVGNHVVTVRVSKQGGTVLTSAGVNFNVTADVDAPNVAVTGASYSYFSLGPFGTEGIVELVVYGSGFDTNCNILYDGIEKNAAIPGIPAGSILGFFSSSVTLPGLNRELYDNALVLHLTSGDIPALGSAHTVRVKNPVSGKQSADLAVTMPARRILLEIDRIDSVDDFPVGEWRNADVGTIERMYTEAGLLVDTRMDSEVADPNAGVSFDMGDLWDFFNNHSDLQGDVYTDQWYMHGAMVTDDDIPPYATGSILGVMFNTNDRESFAVFTDNYASAQNLLRSFTHEMGHGLNLSHCEGDGTVNHDAWGNYTGCNGNGTTIMNQTGCLGAAWVFDFTAGSDNHIANHSLNEVQPGAGNMTFNNAGRVEGKCDH